MSEPITALDPFAPSGQSAISEREGSTIGRYKLFQVIGEGGFGVVYMAEQTAPVTRRVALKIIKLGMDTRQVIARFEAERQALAMMDHPNIAKVLDGGATDSGRPFFVMELVRGVPITEYCDKNHLTPRERLGLFVPVCQAIQHAHQKGVIHRDIKPSNVLVTLHDGKPIPMVIDFGIAKATNQKLTEKTLFTNFASMIGTPAYMSPEQAEMSKLDVDTRSDIYSLGVLLYELLTGTTPFPEKRLRSVGFGEMQRIIAEEEPPRPSTRLSTLDAGHRTAIAKNRAADPAVLNTLFRGDLDWIVMKCLEKDRTRRYETANGLAADLQRHLNNETVLARPPTTAYRLQKAVMRNKLACAATGMIALALALGAAISTWQASVARRAQAAEAFERKAAQSERDRVKAAQAELLKARDAEMNQLARAEAGEAAARVSEYSAMMLLARSDWEANDFRRLRKTLADTASFPKKGFEWYYWQRLAHLEVRTLRGHSGSEYTPWGFDGTVASVNYSPDGQRLVSGGLDGKCIIWDVKSGRELMQLRARIGAVWNAEFSRDGRLVMTSSTDGMIRLWDADKGNERAVLRSSAGISFAIFSPDGALIAGGGEDGSIRLWHTHDRRETHVLRGHMGAVRSLGFSADGKLLASGSSDRTIRVWDVAQGVQVALLQGHGPGQYSLVAAFAPDGVTLASGGDDGMLKFWDLQTRQPKLSLDRGERFLMTLAFSSDGRRLVTAGEDRTIKFWDAKNGSQLQSLRGHEDWVWSVAYSPDGRHLASGSADGTVRIWDLDRTAEAIVLNGHGGWVNSVAYSPTGQFFASAGEDGVIKFWDASRLSVIRALTHGGSVSSIRFSSDGKRLASSSSEGSLRIWSIADGSQILINAGQRKGIAAIAFSPDDRHLVSGGGDKIVALWDSVTGRKLKEMTGHANAINAVAYSGDRSRVASADLQGIVKTWDLNSGEELWSWHDSDDQIGSVAFSPDGSQILVAHEDRTLKLLDAATGRELRVLQGHGNHVYYAAFSPDGQRILSACRDLTVRLWEAFSGRELLCLKEGGSDFLSAALSPDGSRIISGCKDGTIKVWNAASKSEVQKWLAQEEADRKRLALIESEKHRQRNQLRAGKNPLAGALKDWLLLAPIALLAEEDPVAGLFREQFPNEGALRPAASEKVQVAASELTWSPIQLPDSEIDFHRILSAQVVNAVAYAVCYIEATHPTSNAVLQIGTDDQSKVYLNGRLIYTCLIGRPLQPDQDIVTDVELKAGLNVLVLKVVNGIRGWGAALRLTDDHGRALEGTTVTLQPK